MSNFYDPYDPIFYAQESLLILENALGMAGRVHRGYDQERKSAQKGSVIEIKRPSTLTTQEGGTGTVQDLNTEKIQIELTDWRETKFGLTDQELAYTSEQIIREHIGPATYALANYMETALTNLYKYVPWSYNISSTPTEADTLAGRKIIRDNAGALIDTDVVHFAIDSTLEAAFLNRDIFKSAATTGGADNKDALLRGHMGARFGVEHFVQQTLASHTSGTVVSAANDVEGALNGAHSIRATSVSIDGLNTVADETLAAGDSFVIAGHSQRYTVTSNVTLSAGAHASIPIYPALKQDYPDNAVVTFETIGANNYADAYESNLMFHRNAFAIAMAPLPMVGDGAGARMAVIQDPRTGLSVRARVAYDDTNAKVIVTLDVLFGVKCLDPNLAVVMRRDS